MIEPHLVNLAPGDFDGFSALGADECVGMGFAITRKAFRDVFKGDTAAFPIPDYEHAIFFDPYTDNYVVCRPDRDGKYPADFIENLPRIR